MIKTASESSHAIQRDKESEIVSAMNFISINFVKVKFKEILKGIDVFYFGIY